jgi:DinB superfamily
MTAWSELLTELEGMPQELGRALRFVPEERLRWEPESWGGAPGETFSVLGHVCHLRDIERDGYQVRVERLLTESNPSLVSLDGYAIARERRYQSADLNQAVSELRLARATTVERLRRVGQPQLARSGEFAEYGRLTLRALIHYLRSHDAQHLAGIQWLAGKIASEVQ